jgi:hypothetical protein
MIVDASTQYVRLASGELVVAQARSDQSATNYGADHLEARSVVRIVSRVSRSLVAWQGSAETGCLTCEELADFCSPWYLHTRKSCHQDARAQGTANFITGPPHAVDKPLAKGMPTASPIRLGVPRRPLISTPSLVTLFFNDVSKAPTLHPPALLEPRI